jgi:hypothetical protein
MVFNKLRFALLAAACMLVAGCSPDTAYKGPGRLINNGWWDPDHHFVVELGDLDLTKRVSFQRTAAGTLCSRAADSAPGKQRGRARLDSGC